MLHTTLAEGLTDASKVPLLILMSITQPILLLPGSRSGCTHKFHKLVRRHRRRYATEFSLLLVERHSVGWSIRSVEEVDDEMFSILLARLEVAVDPNLTGFLPRLPT